MKWVVRALIVLGLLWAVAMGISLAVAPPEQGPAATAPGAPK